MKTYMTLIEYVEQRYKSTVALYDSCSHEGMADRLEAKMAAYLDVLRYASFLDRNKENKHD